MRKIIGQQGIFITFMAFLLVSTVLALTIATNQAEAVQGQKLAEETAFKTINTRFDNIIQQIGVAKEGDASEAYGRITPFERFSAGENWFEVEQSLPLETAYIENAENALILFSIFATEMGSEGGVFVQVTTPEFDPGDYTPIKYLVKPQCAIFYAEESGDTLTDSFKMESYTGGDCTGFSFASVEKYDVEITVPILDALGIVCTGDFGNVTCKEETNLNYPNESFAIIKINHLGGTEIISANLTTGNGAATVILNANENIVIESTPTSFSTSFSGVAGGSLASFKAKVVFKEPINEITLAPNLFEFGIESKGFNLCRATQKSACEFSIT